MADFRVAAAANAAYNAGNIKPAGTILRDQIRNQLAGGQNNDDNTGFANPFNLFGSNTNGQPANRRISFSA